jgi:hypothetical protein
VKTEEKKKGIVAIKSKSHNGRDDEGKGQEEGNSPKVASRSGKGSESLVEVMRMSEELTLSRRSVG